MSNERISGKAARSAPRKRGGHTAKGSATVTVLDPDNPPSRAADLARMRPVALSKRIRWNLGMSQEAFSEAYHIPIGTLRDWEQYRSEPDAAARTLLLLIEADPKGVVKTLRKVPA